MYSSNPYAQAGWYNPENPMSINSRTLNAAYVPSVFGALPAVDSSSEGRLLTFNMGLNNPDILNCSICGPTGTPYIEITSDYNSAPCTFFRKRDGTVLAHIEWTTRPMVSIPGIVNKQPISQWLTLSIDRRSRMMVSRDKPFTWVPKDNQIALFANEPAFRDPLATISRIRNLVTLKLSTEAVTAGLLESCIVATVLLQSGRNID
ncbi:hypothetical protein JR316_0006234 [Psilocybe cubensis]|uniref:Uncharacterized protein n=1 Tax=Psilocybe cubensis TaxID=181762 RepID=A0ACB8H247_PSICU|nr:hypothetical protein JR316_0006234 [Psilocybe cubensis]KAH9481707.1 hypothetical protein JR316_0006234 [Psilocybe cubensis]